MRCWGFPFSVYLFGNWQGLVSARTLINTFKDYDCKESLGQVQTSLIAYNGDCIAVPRGAHSVRLINVDKPCAVTLYVDDCSGKNATLAPLNECTAMDTIETLSVDCTALSNQSSWTTAKSTDAIKTTNSSSRSSTLSSRSAHKPQSPIDRSTTLISSASRSTSPLILTDSRSPPTRAQASSSTTDATIPHDSTPNTVPQNERTTNSNLSKGAEVALGVVVPCVSVLCAVIFGINQWNKRPKGSGRTSLARSNAGRTRETRGTTEREIQSREGEGPSLSSHPQVLRSNKDIEQGW